MPNIGVYFPQELLDEARRNGSLMNFCRACQEGVKQELARIERETPPDVLKYHRDQKK